LIPKLSQQVCNADVILLLAKEKVQKKEMMMMMMMMMMMVMVLGDLKSQLFIYMTQPRSCDPQAVPHSEC